MSVLQNGKPAGDREPLEQQAGRLREILPKAGHAAGMHRRSTLPLPHADRQHLGEAALIRAGVVGVLLHPVHDHYSVSPERLAAGVDLDPVARSSHADGGHRCPYRCPH